jgi:imidazolonepropionase-like amidohydrolase
MAEVLFKNFELLDVHQGVLKSGHQPLVKDDRIAAVKKGAINAPKAETVEGGGRTLMPGLIDCHLHIHNRGRLGPAAYPQALPSLQNATAGDVLKGMLMRGFTTARDAAGADLGHSRRSSRDYSSAPGCSSAGAPSARRAGTATAGPRPIWSTCVPASTRSTAPVASPTASPGCARPSATRSALAPKPSRSTPAGGVASASDPIDQLQHSMDELKAAVDEATRSHIYCLAHVYTDAGIKRCLEAGIRAIENGNFLEPDTAAQMAASGTYLVPTLVTYRALKKHGTDMRLSADEMGKIDYVLSAGTRSLEIAKAAGVKMAYGSDVFRSGEHYETKEFLVRAEVLPAIDVIRSATLIGAEVVGLDGQVGIVEAGAFADFIVVDGNPLDDLGLFHDEGAHMSAIMKEGHFYKNRLQATESDHPSARETL